MGLKTEDFGYLKKLVKADIEAAEKAGPKSNQVGWEISLDYKRRVYKALKRITD